MKRFEGWGERESGIAAAFLAVLLAGGCDTTHFRDGNTGAAGADGGGEPVNLQLDAGYPGDVSSLGAREAWTGYLENYQFASGSDAIALSFATDPTGIVLGTVTLGAGSPPPPATDPEAVYPPGYTRFSGITEGFPFTMAQGTLIGSRLRFTIWVTEVWSGWCALQTPIPGSPWCVPYRVYASTSDDSQCSYQSAPNVWVAARHFLAGTA